MKNIYCLLLLVIVLVACKKSKLAENGANQKMIKSIEESYLGTNTKYFLAYNSTAQLSVYESEDKKFRAQYSYDRGKPQRITYKIDTVTYELLLNYNAGGIMENGSFTTRWASGREKEDTIAVSNTDGKVKLSFFKGIYHCVLKNENLISVAFNAWYFKRTVDISYGINQCPVYGTNLILPKGELNDPLNPSSVVYTSIFHMLLSAFSKNNVLSVNSGLYIRSFKYEKDEMGKVSSVSIQASRKVEGELQVMEPKLITYTY